MSVVRPAVFILAGAIALILGLSLPVAEAGNKRPGGFTSAKGMRIDGVTTEIENKPTLQSCRDWCQRSSLCAAVQFDATKNECRYALSVLGTKPAGDNVTVSVFTEAQHIPKLQAMASTRWTQRDAPGHDRALLRGVPDEHICSAICTGDPHCDAWVYRASADLCWLKDGVPMRQNAAGLVSAYVPWEEERRKKPADLTFKNGKVSGALWKVEQTGKRQDAAVVACRNMCRGNGSCKAAIIERDTGSCRMFKSIQPSTIEQSPQYEDDALFLRLDFKGGVRFVALKQGTEKKADQPGNDLRMQTIMHPDLCRAVCALDSSCSALTMNNSSKNGVARNECYLKSRASNPSSFANWAVGTSWLAGDDR